MNKRLRRAVRDKTRLYNKFKKYPNSRNWETYRLQRNLTTTIRKASIRDYFKSKCSEGVKNPNFWKTVKPFLTDKGSKTGDSISIRKDNEILTDPKTVANEMNNFYVNIASQIGGNLDLEQGLDSNPEFVTKCISHFKDHPSVVSINSKMKKHAFTLKHTDIDTVQGVIKNLDLTKATGSDQIPPKLLKPIAPFLCHHVKDIFNQCVDLSEFPKQAKNADVVPLYKKGDNLMMKNYRPVSILPCLSKILERTMLLQLNLFLDQILDPRVSAYRTGYSCQYALLRLIEDYKRALDDKKQVASTLMDLSKAFDCLSHPLIVAKLYSYGLSVKGCCLIWSYLTNRSQRVKLAGFRSEPLDLIKGVPQGSVLGPVLFNVFINDLFATLDHSLLTNYADDNTITVIQDSRNSLIRTLTSESERAISWFECNMMEANPSKFQLLFMKSKNKVTFQIGGNRVDSEDCVTLLGVILDKNLSFNEQISQLCRKAASQLAVLQRLSKHLDYKARMAIFRCFILSHFGYCNLVWHFCGVSNTAKLERLQYRALKFVHQDWNSSYEDLLERSQLPTLELARTRSILLEVYKAVKHISPSFMWNLFTPKESRYNLRNKNQLCINHSRTKGGMNSLSIYGAKLWNQLPDNFKNCELQDFKAKLASWYPPKCRCSACRS